MKGWLFLLLPAVAAAQSSKKVQLTGNLHLQQPVAKVFISYRVPGDAISDSVQPKNGTFTYKTTLAEPTLAMVRVQYAGQPEAKSKPISFFLQPGNLSFTATDSLPNFTLTGAPAQDDFKQLTAQEKPFADSLDKLYDAWSAAGKGNKPAQQAVETQIDAVDSALRETVYRPFITSHPQSPIALYVLKQYAGYDMDADKAEPLYNLVPAATKQWPSAVAFKEALDIAKKTGVGRMAMDFTQDDTSGHAVSLSSFKGKYVLVDFWASWCGPCRAENPNVVKAFQQYNGNGFTVLGVSLDRPGAKDRWLKAIHDDSLTWTHVSDLKFWDNAVAKQYGVRAIPQNFLIDPQGKIIGRNLRGEALERKLAQLFGTASTF